MPISTVTFQMNALAQMEALNEALARSQSELATGKKLQTAADNPAAMAQVNALNVQLSVSQQGVTNGNAVRTSLQLEQNALSSASNVLQSVREVALQANNSDLNPSERQSLAAQLQQLQQALLAAANTRDGNGAYLFAGTATTAQPFVQAGNSVSYLGTAAVNQVQISPDQSLSVSDAGSSVFMNIPTGNGTFTTAVGPANTGNASIDPGTVSNASAWVADTYSIAFTSPTQYQVSNSSGTVVGSGSFQDGDSIAFNGVSVTLSGTPAAGDQFTIAPAGKASAFATVSSLIATLGSGNLSNAQLATQIGQAVQQLDSSLDRLNNIQAGVGSRLNAISDAADSAQASQTTLQTTVSQLTDVDYAAAVTKLSTQELALQAAQESYASIARLSLFNYLP